MTTRTRPHARLRVELRAFFGSDASQHVRPVRCDQGFSNLAADECAQLVRNGAGVLVGARADPVHQCRHREKRLLEALLERLPDLLHPGHRPPLAATRTLFVNSVRPERHGRLPTSLHEIPYRDHADPGTGGQPFRGTLRCIRGLAAQVLGAVPFSCAAAPEVAAPRRLTE